MAEAVTAESESSNLQKPYFPDPSPHSPTIFWIGCSDGRVQESAILPGKEIFTQRNIANQFHLVDGNSMSGLAYTVVNLKTITHIMVVGHTDCGGVGACYSAALDGSEKPVLDSIVWKWLGPLRVLAELFVKQGRSERDLTNENVKVQVHNVLSALQWLPPPLFEGRTLTLSGHVYNMHHLPLPKLEQVVQDITYPSYNLPSRETPSGPAS